MEWTQNPTSSTYVLVRNDTQNAMIPRIRWAAMRSALIGR